MAHLTARSLPLDILIFLPFATLPDNQISSSTQEVLDFPTTVILARPICFSKEVSHPSGGSSTTSRRS